MGEHEGAFGVGIVGNNETLALCTVRFTLGEHLVGLDEFEELRGFASWSSAHIEDGMVSLDIEQDGGHHAYNFLSRDKTRISHEHDQFVDVLEPFVLLQALAGDHHFEKSIVRVEWLEIHLQLAEVDFNFLDARFNHLSLIHIDSWGIGISFWLFFVFLLLFLLSCSLFDEFRDEVGVLEPLAHLSEAGLARSQSEGDRKLVVESLQEGAKLFLCGHDVGEDSL